MRSETNPLLESVEDYYYMIQVAQWLYRCRHFVERKNCASDEEYQDMVDAFCKDWEKHYENHKKFYNAKKFKDAILAQRRLDQVRFDLKTETGAIDITEDILLNSFMQTMPELKKDYEGFGDPSKGITDFTFDEYQRLAQKAINAKKDRDFKDGLWSLAAYHAVLEIRYAVYISDKHKEISVKTLREALDLTKKPGYVLRFSDPKHKAVKRIAGPHRRAYSEWLNKFGVLKSTFNSYIKDLNGDADYNKRFAANLAFAFYFDVWQTNTLMKRMGYTLEGSFRPLDKYLLSAFSAGQTREYVMARIEKHNRKAETDSSTLKIVNL